MPTLAKNQARQVSRIGETPAEARARMRAAEGKSESEPKGEEVEGPLSPEHLAAIREAEEGFGGGPVDGGTVEEAEETTEPPTPSKAMEVIRQLSQDKLQLQAEQDSALNLVARYKAQYGELD
jgi:hypothetical protein